jgi:O-antigen/teichoic acid export membrane protein
MISVPFTGAGLTLLMLILARHDFRWVNRARVLPPLLAGLGIAGLALSGTAAPGPAAVAYLAGGPVAMLIVLACVWRRLAPSLENFAANARELLGYGLRVYAGELAGILYLHFDRLLLIAIAEPRAVGFYVVAYNLSRLVPVLIEHSVSFMLSPKASSADFAGARRLTLTAAAGGAALAAILILLPTAGAA